MSKIKELFGVEIEEKFEIEDEKSSSNWEGCYFSEDGGLHIPHTCLNNERKVMKELITGESKIIKIKPPILTSDERDYLQAICNQKFYKGKIIDFVKEDLCRMNLIKISNNKNYITLELAFDNKDLFKGMKFEKNYTPEQLGIQS